jgi:CRP-like cAMP-binding protein
MLTSGEVSQALVYFPETLVVSIAGRDRETGIGLIGREGVIGWAALLGCPTPDDRVRVELANGSALTISCDRLRSACALSPTLLVSLMRFAQTFAVQMSRTLVSTLHASLEVRVASWVLMFHDRVDGDEIAITHAALATLLSARRAGVTDAMHVLEGERLVRCTRGRIVVRERALLEDFASATYGAPERAYRSSIAPFGKSQRAGLLAA